MLDAFVKVGHVALGIAPEFVVIGARQNEGNFLTAVAVLTLALGIGVISAVYSIGNGLLWRPLPVPGAERLAVLFARTHSGTVYEDYSWGEYPDFRAGTAGVFEDVAALSASPFSVAHDGPAERIWGEIVSANYFIVLAAPMTLGRGFGPAEDSSGAEAVVILSHAVWQARFHGDPGILGRTMRINRQDFTVVGVAAQGFQSPFYVGFSPAIWLPIGNSSTDSDTQPATLRRVRRAARPRNTQCSTIATASVAPNDVACSDERTVMSTSGGSNAAPLAMHTSSASVDAVRAERTGRSDK